MPSNPELLAAYDKMATNPFWLEYRKRLAGLQAAANVTLTTQVVEDQADMWNMAKAQGSIAAFRTALSLPESMIGLHDTKGK